MQLLIRLFSTTILFLFVLQTSYNTIVWMQFKISESYIVKELCVQKNKENNTCNGSCYLKAHLSTDKHASENSISYSKDKIDLFCSFAFLSIEDVDVKQTNYFFSFICSMPTNRARDFFFFSA